MSSVHQGIPFLPEGVLDPAPATNNAIRVFDDVVQCAVISMALTAPPVSPADGDRYIVASPATGDWALHENDMASFVAEGTEWEFYAPTQVNYVLNQADQLLYLFDASSSPGSWAPLTGGGGGGTVDSIVAGTNVTVDDTDPANPIVSAASGSGVVESIVEGTGVTVDDTDPANPIVGVAPSPLLAATYTATHNMVLGDQYKGVTMNVASANNFEIQPNASVACDVGAVVAITQLGAGQTTITAAGGVTLEYDSVGLFPRTRAQYSQISAWQRATDVWLLSGDMEPV